MILVGPCYAWSLHFISRLVLLLIVLVYWGDKWCTEYLFIHLSRPLGSIVIRTQLQPNSPSCTSTIWKSCYSTISTEQMTRSVPARPRVHTKHNKDGCLSAKAKVADEVASRLHSGNLQLWFGCSVSSDSHWLSSHGLLAFILPSLHRCQTGYHGNQDGDAARAGGAVVPDVSQRAAVVPDQEEDLHFQVRTRSPDFGGRGSDHLLEWKHHKHCITSPVFKQRTFLRFRPEVLSTLKRIIVK